MSMNGIKNSALWRMNMSTTESYKGYKNYITWCAAYAAICALDEYDLEVLEGLWQRIETMGAAEAFQREFNDLLESGVRDYEGVDMNDIIYQYGFLNIDMEDAASEWKTDVQERIEELREEEESDSEEEWGRRYKNDDGSYGGSE